MDEVVSTVVGVKLGCSPIATVTTLAPVYVDSYAWPPVSKVLVVVVVEYGNGVPYKMSTTVH